MYFLEVVEIKYLQKNFFKTALHVKSIGIFPEPEI